MRYANSTFVDVATSTAEISLRGFEALCGGVAGAAEVNSRFKESIQPARAHLTLAFLYMAVDRNAEAVEHHEQAIPFRNRITAHILGRTALAFA